MTEQEWNTCTDPSAMLEHLRATGGASERKLRLFAVACCRRVWHLLREQDSRRAVEVAERFADGVASEESRRTACDRAFAVSQRLYRPEQGYWADLPFYRAAEAAAFTVATRDDADMFSEESPFMLFLVEHVERCTADAVSETSSIAAGGREAVVSALQRESWHHCLLLRDLFSIRTPPPLDLSVRTWNYATVPRIARAIYDDGAFDRLPVLADALEEAGCDNPDVIGHCRQQDAVHVRGCWLLDLLLERA
jgi:hypothetical protein